MNWQRIIKTTLRLAGLAGLSLFVLACSGNKTFNDYARMGDTVAVAMGFQTKFALDQIDRVDIAKGPNIFATIPAGDPAIRASVNFYPDPLSGLIVSRETGIEFTAFADTYENTITTNYTDGDKDWFQTVVFVDLPSSGLTVGENYAVRVYNTDGDFEASSVEIIAGVGSPSTFSAVGADLDPDMIEGISRMPHFTVDFTGATIPHAVEVTLTHDADSTAGGTGKAHAVNPIGYRKNLSWNDDGTEMKVIMMPAGSLAPDNIKDFKFYVTGGISNLVVSSTAAYDVNGNPVAGVSATATETLAPSP